MATKYQKLRGRIVEKFGTQEAFCKELGISSVTMSSRMTGKTGFTYNDIIEWSSLLDIPTEEIGEFFYAPNF